MRFVTTIMRPLYYRGQAERIRTSLASGAAVETAELVLGAVENPSASRIETPSPAIQVERQNRHRRLEGGPLPAPAPLGRAPERLGNRERTALLEDVLLEVEGGVPFRYLA